MNKSIYLVTLNNITGAVKCGSAQPADSRARLQHWIDHSVATSGEAVLSYRICTLDEVKQINDNSVPNQFNALSPETANGTYCV